jgi:hypothetical protein
VIRVTLTDAAVGTGSAAALPAVSAWFGSGAPTLLATEGGARPTVLSLVASGRMKLDSGSVTAVRIGAGGAEQPLTTPALRRAIALIDTPLVADHPDDVSVGTVVREERALAKARLGAAGASENTHKQPFGSLGAAERVRLLIDLALERPGVEGVVVTSPERHDGDPATWWRVVRETAARGIAVLVVTDAATVAHLDRLPHPEPLGRDAVPLFDTVPTVSGGLAS